MVFVRNPTVFWTPRGVRPRHSRWGKKAGEEACEGAATDLGALKTYVIDCEGFLGRPDPGSGSKAFAWGFILMHTENQKHIGFKFAAWEKLKPFSFSSLTQQHLGFHVGGNWWW